MSARQINAAGLEIVKRNEGCRLEAYRDTGSVWTIGWGHTPAISGARITQETADALLRADLDKFESAVCQVTASVPTTDNQFSAMVSLAFNVGEGAFRRSTVLQKHRLGNYAEAADAFMMFDKGHVGGVLVVLPGLARRRGEERSLYLDQGASAQPARNPSHRKTDPDHSANDLNRAELKRIKPKV